MALEGARAAVSPDGTCNPEAGAVRAELCDFVRNALSRLSEIHRDVVILHELHGCTYQECAELLGVPVGTVKSRLANAFRRLRESLEGYVRGEPEAIRPEIIRESLS